MSQNSRHILIIGTIWPEPDSSAAGRRMLQLINLFRQQGWDVTFATSASESEFKADLKIYGVICKSIELNSSSFDDYILKIKPSVVMFDRFMTEEQYGWRVSENCPDALRILDTEDLHCLRTSRHEAWKYGKKFKQENLLASELAKREIASIYRSDLSLIISEVEMEILTHLFRVDDSLLFYTPFLFDPVEDGTFSGLQAFENRLNFITIGNFLHEPNWNSVLWLKEEVWPLIRKKIPEAELHIYGAYPSEKVFRLHNTNENFFIKGRAESVKSVIGNSRVMLAPLRFGAGLKGKLLDAMLYGTPSVTTSVGAEGIPGEYAWPGMIEDDSVSFANAAVELYTSENNWKIAEKNGIPIINNRFSGEEHGRPLIRRIENLLSRLEIHRKKNFTGSMLRHHSHASTKFMSKWIEEKNKSV